MRHHDNVAKQEAVRELIAEARRRHRAWQGVDWQRDYEHLKRLLKGIFDEGTDEYLKAFDEVLAALECGE